MCFSHFILNPPQLIFLGVGPREDNSGLGCRIMLSHIQINYTIQASISRCRTPTKNKHSHIIGENMIYSTRRRLSDRKEFFSSSTHLLEKKTRPNTALITLVGVKGVKLKSEWIFSLNFRFFLYRELSDPHLSQIDVV